MLLHLHTWYHISMLVAGLSAFITAFIALQQRPARGAVVTALLLFAVAFWSFTSMGEYAVHSVTEKLFWIKLEYPFITFCTPLWFMMSMVYVGHEELLTRRNVFLICIIPTLTVLMNWTNEYHHLFYTATQLEMSLDMPLLNLSYGPWFYLFAFYSYGLCFAALVLCTQAMFSSTPFYRKQFSVIFVAALVPLVFNALYIFRLGPTQYLDLTPLAFCITGALVVWGMRRYHYWDMVPVAYDMIVENLTDGIVVLDYQLRILSMNPAAEKFIGYEEHTATGKKITEIAPEWEHLAAPLPADAAEHNYSIRIDTPTHTIYDIRVILFRKLEYQSPGRLIVIRDDTERNTLKERLQTLAFFDHLTGLPNRALFMDRLEQALAVGQRIGSATAVMFLDLDGFKNINDKLGHSVGDEMLRQVASRLDDGVRTSDTVARLGGDEFVIILSGVTSAEDIDIAARRFLDAFIQKFTLGAHVRKITASIGVAVAPYDGNTVEELMRHADTAMYRAKHHGKNTYRLFSAFPEKRSEDD